MDNPTRIGIGAGAAFTLSAMAQPLITWWASAPLMAAFGGVALWGLWPIAEQSVGFKWPLSPVSLYSVSILTAARKSYEESERLGLDDLFTGNSQSPDEKLS